VIVADTSVVYALLDRRDHWHERVASWYRRDLPELATTPLVLAEIDHLAGARAGPTARAAWRRDLAAGVYAVEWWPSAGSDSAEIATIYDDAGVSLTDASLVALAARLETIDVATLDERHFRLMRPLAAGVAFRLLPIDE
jgi:hypothetical protein